MTLAANPTAKPARFIVKADGKVIGKAELRKVPVAVIRMDLHYQRDTSAAWITDHLPFDAQQAGAIVLSGRMGGPFCIDGGHRVALATASGVEFINAYIIEGLTQADEARLFTRYQRERRNLTSFALFRADLVAGDKDTLAMVRVVHAAGYTLERKGGANNITAIDSLRYIQRLGGNDLLGRTLGTVSAIWSGEDKALSGQVLKGVSIFLASAGRQPSFKVEHLERVMTELAPAKVLRLAMAIADKRNSADVGPANIAEALHAHYNKTLSKRELPLEELTVGTKRRPKART